MRRIPLSYRLVGGVIVIVSLFLAAVFGVGYLAGQAFTYQEAIEAGVGSYTPDGREWKWGKK